MAELKDQVYVLFHGMWAFEVVADGIDAHTPINENHMIAAGFLEFPDDCSVNQGPLTPLLPGEAWLKGVDKGCHNRFNDKLNAMVYEGKMKKPHQRYCVVHLPPAEHIRSLRSVEVKHPPEHPFGGVTGELMNPKIVSMVQLFVYNITQNERPDISPPGRVHVQPARHGAPMKLHVYAESLMAADRYHARNAYTTTADMFGLDIVPIAPLFVAAADPTGIPGLYRQDLEGLGESMMKSMTLGESGSNCDAFVIDTVHPRPSSGE